LNITASNLIPNGRCGYVVGPTYDAKLMASDYPQSRLGEGIVEAITKRRGIYIHFKQLQLHKLFSDNLSFYRISKYWTKIPTWPRSVVCSDDTSHARLVANEGRQMDRSVLVVLWIGPDLSKLATALLCRVIASKGTQWTMPGCRELPVTLKHNYQKAILLR